MCSFSFIATHYEHKIPDMFPWTTYPNEMTVHHGPERKRLREEMESVLELLRAAKAYDDEKGIPDCESEEKKVFLRKIAAIVGLENDPVLN